MSDRQNFEYSDDVSATWDIIDRLSRMVWEREQVSRKTGVLVNEAARDFHSALRDASRDLPQRTSASRAEPPTGANVDEGNGFRSFIVDKLAKLVISRDVGSVAEAFLKATPALDKMRSTVGDGKAGFVFRGQRNIQWPLVSTLGRDAQFLAHFAKVGEQEFLADRRSKTSKYECDLLLQFQKEWSNHDEVDPLDQSAEIGLHDSTWWFRMQHYSNGLGTRLLDVTSSIPAALLFACLNWESGLVDDSTDGVLYLFVQGMNANIVDFTSSAPTPPAVELFSEQTDAPVFIITPPTQRAK